MVQLLTLQWPKIKRWSACCETLGSYAWDWLRQRAIIYFTLGTNFAPGETNSYASASWQFKHVLGKRVTYHTVLHNQCITHSSCRFPNKIVAQSLHLRLSGVRLETPAKAVVILRSGRRWRWGFVIRLRCCRYRRASWRRSTPKQITKCKTTSNHATAFKRCAPTWHACRHKARRKENGISSWCHWSLSARKSTGQTKYWSCTMCFNVSECVPWCSSLLSIANVAVWPAAEMESGDDMWDHELTNVVTSAASMDELTT